MITKNNKDHLIPSTSSNVDPPGIVLFKPKFIFYDTE